MKHQIDAHSWNTFSVSTAAARLGIAPATLRTWVRRHGVGPSIHKAGKHRRFSEFDIARLMVMRAAILRGATTSEGAKAALEYSFEDLTIDAAESQLRDALSRSGGNESGNEGKAGLHLLSLDEQARSHGDVRFIGGSAPVTAASKVFSKLSSNVHELPPVAGMGLKERATRLVGAALRNDLRACAQLLEIQDGESIVDWWTLFVRPSMERIQTHTVLALPGKTPQLLIGFCAQQALEDFVGRVRKGNSTHPSKLKNVALVFTPEHDEFAMPAQALTAALIQQKSVAHVILGPGNSDRAAELIKIVRPSVVVFASDLIQPSLEILSYLSSEFTELPIYVGLREGIDLGEYRKLSHVVALNSFTALFHEVHNLVRSAAPELQYWDHGGEMFALRSV